MTSIRRLADVRLWVLFALLTTAACSSSEPSSCEPGDPNYPECAE
jgi:hypothetical protein